MKLHGKPLDNIVQAYTPTVDRTGKDIDVFYKEQDMALDECKKLSINDTRGLNT